MPRLLAQRSRRIVKPLVVNSSEDLAIVAKGLSHKMPRLVRYLMDGRAVGPQAEQGAEGRIES